MAEPLRILITDPLHPDGVDRLAGNPAYQVLEHVRPDPATLVELVPTVDAWIVRSGTQVTAELLAQARRLKVVARAGVGVDNIDVEAATRQGVLVMNAPDANAITTAELALAHLLSLARHLVAGDRMVRGGGWDRKALMGTELDGKILGVLGLGRIGRQVARRARGLGLEILGHDPYVTPAALGGLEIDLVTLPEMFARADFLTLHAPLNEHTRGLLNREAFAAMKPGMRLVNCARGALIVEQDLLDALEQGIVAGAALDVFLEEPPPTDSPLLQHPRVVTTPHLGASTEEAGRKVALAVVDQVNAFLETGRVTNSVNLPSVASEASEALAPFLALARTAGSFLCQIVDWPVTELRAEYRGEVADQATQPLTLAFLQGFLSPILDAPVNLVNARLLATERGLDILESTSAQPRDFASLLRFEVTTAQGPRSLEGALFGHRMARLVMLDDCRMEIVPEGDLVVLRNQDQPGVIGKVGTMLGNHGLNIGNMHVSPPAADGLCYAVLGVEQPLSDELRQAILEMPEIHDVRQVHLP